MANAVEHQRSPILRTKLHRPLWTEGLIHRGRLHERMDLGLQTPLTVVSAPAGYGKSTLVSHWAESLDHPCAWVSLDQADSEPAQFLAYLQHQRQPGPSPAQLLVSHRGEMTGSSTMPTPINHKEIEFWGTATYRIVIQGALSSDWSDRLAGLAITTTRPAALDGISELNDIELVK